MLRFPYRQVSAFSGPTVAARPFGIVSRLIQLVFRKSIARHQPSNQGGMTAPRPIVPIRIRGPVAARRLRSALLDTGSQDSLFPFAIAEPIGVILGGTRGVVKWRGTEYWVEFHEVDLELAQNEQVWRWRARVGFTSAPLAYALLGHRGCLDYFDAKFRGADQVVELETNRAFSGTTIQS